MSMDQSGFIPVPPPPGAQGMPMPPAGQPYPGYPQPGVWPGQYPGMPMYAMPKPPTPLSDAKLFMEKMPLAALVAAAGVGVFALFSFIASMIALGGSSAGAAKAVVVMGAIGGLGLVCTGAVVVFAALMSIKRFADLRQAKLDAMAAATEAAKAAADAADAKKK